jgi:hypothetical protein
MKRPDHLKFIRKLPCVICGKSPCDAAHIRYSSSKWGKANAMGAKPDDKWTVPLCRKHHRRSHCYGEQRWWNQQGVDPLALADDLFGATGNHELGVEIVRDSYLRTVI